MAELDLSLREVDEMLRRVNRICDVLQEVRKLLLSGHSTGALDNEEIDALCERINRGVDTESWRYENTIKRVVELLYYNGDCYDPEKEWDSGTLSDLDEIMEAFGFVPESPVDPETGKAIKAREPDPEMVCHNPRCSRRHLSKDSMAADTEPFYWSNDMDSWACPACGGSDVH